MVSLNPAQIASTNSFMIFEATKLDNAHESAHTILDNLDVQKLGSRQVQDFRSTSANPCLEF